MLPQADGRQKLASYFRREELTGVSLPINYRLRNCTGNYPDILSGQKLTNERRQKNKKLLTMAATRFGKWANAPHRLTDGTKLVIRSMKSWGINPQPLYRSAALDYALDIA
jgi:hypothetical protein